MGMYDSFIYNGNIELQLKNGDCCLHEFHIDDSVKEFGYEDGIYLDVSGKGVVVVWGGFYVAAFDTDCFKDKWGNELDFFRIQHCIKNQT